MRNALLTTTMLTMFSLSPVLAIAQETPPPEMSEQEAAQQEPPVSLVSAYEQYAVARLSFEQAQADGQSGEMQAESVAAARTNLKDECSSLGVSDLAACLDRFVPAELRIPNDLSPLTIQVAPVEAEESSEAAPEMADESDVEMQESEPAPQVPEAPEADMQADAELDAQQSESDTQEDVTELPVQEEPAQEEPVQEDMPAPEVEAEVQSEVEVVVETPAELMAAYDEYSAARMAIIEAQAADSSADAAVEMYAAARDNLLAVCAELGVSDLSACLDQFIAPEMRVPNDVQPLNIEMGTTTEVEVTENADEAATEEEASDQTAEPVEPVEDATSQPEDVAPVLDSAKEEPTAPAEQDETSAPDAEADVANEAEVTDDVKPEANSDGPPPQNDAEAQEAAAPKEMTSITAEKGERVDATSKAEATTKRGAPESAKVIQQNNTDFRVVFQFNNQVIVENQDNSRLEQDSSETYVERLRNGRTRETIVRPDGSELVTIYNRNGDIIRRSRFTPDGDEYVLVYVDESYEEDLLEWRDPALDLGPLRLDIPVSDYILDADEADEDELVQFLDQPPVERVQRLYSINEVKRSARVRDMVRRLEVGGLTFQSGKATIATDQVAGLTNVANAMLDMLDNNPAETFLIEGHTDAVGDEIYNLELSDRRAETVAVILSRAFGIPPENLATQGYGERYLKVRTQDADRRNRRVTIKRITPLISPVAQR